MDPELYEKAPVRRWKRMTSAEQREALGELRDSNYFRLLPRRMQAMLNRLT